MPDFYQVPALVLTAFLLPAFGFLYLRFRDTRTLLWFLGFLFATIRMVLLYKLGSWDFSDGAHPWMTAAGQTSIQLGSALFLASLSPLSFRLGRYRILYVIPFTIPLVIYSLLFHGILHGKVPPGPMFLVFPALGVLSLVAGIFWGIAKGSLPTWIGVTFAVVGGCIGLWVYFAMGPLYPLSFVECCDHLLTALLVVYVFRRFSTGMMLTVMGFAAWSAPFVLTFHFIYSNPDLDLAITRAIILAKVVAAMGMILLAFEDQLAINLAAQERERRARRELEAYTNLILSRRRVEDFDCQGEEVCQTVVRNSRFAQAALLLQSGGQYRLAGSAGMDAAVTQALASLVGRIPVERFLEPSTSSTAVEHTQTVNLDLTPWLIPGDDLKRLRFTAALAVPMPGRASQLGAEGALLLAGIRNLPGTARAAVENKLYADDLLPAEMLIARLQAARSQTMMLEKLIDSEKFAGLGQLAANVTEQLNNPLTVVLGYASLLEEAESLDNQDRKGVEAILSEARRMKTTLESLSRISRHQGDQLSAVSVTEILADMEELHRPEFLQRSIDFRLSLAPSLPMVLCNPQHLRHAVLHCLQFAIQAVDRNSATAIPISSVAITEPRTIRLEATSEGNVVQILVAHSGPGFVQPDRAFDPYASTQPTGETTGLGLSLCATILRDNSGRASAVNLEPSGAAIILELQAA